MKFHPILAMSQTAHAAAQRDRDEWLRSPQRIAWLMAEGEIQ